MHDQRPTTISHAPQTLRPIALFFMALSFPMYGLMLYLPFSQLEPTHKFLFSAGLFIASEIAFWGGAMLLGKEMYEQYRDYLTLGYWFRDP